MRRVIRIVLVGFVVASPFLVHWALAAGWPGVVAHGLIILQAASIGGFACSKVRSPYRIWAIAALLLALVALACIRITDGIFLSWGLPHAMIYLSLLALFGGSLLPGREPIVTYFARL